MIRCPQCGIALTESSNDRLAAKIERMRERQDRIDEIEDLIRRLRHRHYASLSGKRAYDAMSSEFRRYFAGDYKRRHSPEKYSGLSCPPEIEGTNRELFWRLLKLGRLTFPGFSTVKKMMAPKNIMK